MRMAKLKKLFNHTGLSNKHGCISINQIQIMKLLPSIMYQNWYFKSILFIMSLCITDNFRIAIKYDISTVYGDVMNYTQLLDMDNSKGEFSIVISLVHLIWIKGIYSELI